MKIEPKIPSKKPVIISLLLVIVAAIFLSLYFNGFSLNKISDVEVPSDEATCTTNCVNESPPEQIVSKSDQADETTSDSLATYIVQSGDTLFSISRKYNMSVEGLQRLNSLGDSTLIYTGQVLKVSSESSDEEATTTPAAEPTPAEISRGDTSKKQVIFTFDAGSGSQSLNAILDVLSKHNVKGTFFLTGKWAEANPSGLNSIASAGHEIFNHTYSHPDLTTVSNDTIAGEFLQTENIIKNATGKTTKPYFRPPYGARNQNVWNAAWTSGYRSVYWTIDAWDWKTDATTEIVKERILSNLTNGCIYLMHVGDDITGQILDEVFTMIENDGYSIVSLSSGI